MDNASILDLMALVPKEIWYVLAGYVAFKLIKKFLLLIVLAVACLIGFSIYQENPQVIDDLKKDVITELESRGVSVDELKAYFEGNQAVLEQAIQDRVKQSEQEKEQP